MVTKFFLRPTSLSFTSTTTITLSLSKLTTTTTPNSLLSTSTAKAQTSLHYGPSLQKGQNPSPRTSQNATKLLQTRNKQRQEEKLCDFTIDEEEFTRIYDISALRVPAKECYALESRLRGHLLNWPRVRNIARVPGDDVEGELAPLLVESGNVGGGGGGGGDEENSCIDSLNRRLYGRGEGDGEEMSDVLYREKLGKDFNARGFVKFRTLARISRPKKRKRKEGKEMEIDGKLGRRDGNGFSIVEVVMDEDDEERETREAWNGLLGDEIMRRKKWRGPTRLLLLDERYSNKGVEELPPAVKVGTWNSMRMV